MGGTGREAERLARLRAAMEHEGLDAVAIVPGANFYYLTGASFHLMERPTLFVVTSEGLVHAVMPVLERSRWQAVAPDAETTYWQDADGYEDAFAALARRIAPARIGVEGQRMRVFEAEALRRALPAAAVVDAQAAISGMRLLKDAAEIDALRRAIAISEAALAATLGVAAAGMTETAFRGRLAAEMLDAGADGLSFEPIVLAGPASADPHGSASPDRRLERGQPLLIDYGAAWGGYMADITRTVFVGAARPEHADIYEAVRLANEVGRTVAAPPMTLDALDRRVTESLRGSGFAELVVHKTGHGLGLDVHEAPQVMVGNLQPIEAGMVFTIEPGLYREGDIGVRIEDDVLATASGATSLTSFERSLTLIG
ncbi:Xaa-Pro peptidase family protein [Amaricoccus sp.]|uniref:M24 family metallopeptidase n=1 Tax=Amaricoccus sp. TaxID=1872485 RepID=UPI001B6F0802|nr:Xaa-Pro peptidase family protein [Amaricoccus sp.]MBP7240508.1 aminopeptidase P family protein [Amaricoccus sp.]